MKLIRIKWCIWKVGASLPKFNINYFPMPIVICYKIFLIFSKISLIKLLSFMVTVYILELYMYVQWLSTGTIIHQDDMYFLNGILIND